MTADKPNILFVTSHDIGRHMRCYGVETVHTPRFDAFAAQGVRFAHAFCVAPQCSPSRSSLFTGRYPHQNGVMGLTHDYFAWDLHDDERHLAALLNDAGYYTVGTGVIHECHDPARPGFDRVLSDQAADANALNAPVFRFLREERPADQPFYLQVGYFEPHRTENGFGAPPDTEHGITIPPFLKDEESAHEDLAGFQGAIRRLDDAFGALLDVLAEQGLAESTLVIFTADHGIPFPRAKCSLYDPGLEVALIMRWPGGPWAAGDVVESLVSNIDVTPSLLELLGLPVPENMQGHSFVPVLGGDITEARDVIYGEMTYHDYTDPRRCIRSERYKLIVNFTAAYSFMDPSQQWRPNTVTTHPENPQFSYHVPVELYDLQTDPLEHHNLAGADSYAVVRDELLARLYGWMQQTGDPLLDGIPTPPMHRFALRALLNADRRQDD